MSSTVVCPFVHRAVYERIRYIYEDQESEELENKLASWFKSSPRYSTVRVNFPKDVEEARKELQEIVDDTYAKRNQISPTVYIHHTLKDLLVIPSPDVPDPEVNSDKEIIVDVYCGSAVLRGANIFVPGVLGAPSDLREYDTVAVYADVTGKCLKGFKKKFDGPKVFLGIGVATCSREDLFGQVCRVWDVAVQMMNTFGNCPALGDHVLGQKMFLQNLPSVLCSHVLNPSPTDCILDMCAAPGGKTTHLASMMQGNGLIIALDRSKARIDKLKSNVQLSGYTNIHAFAYDSTKALDLNKLSPDSDSALCQGSVPPPPYLPNMFDCIMLDAPCSALGQRPQWGNRMTESEFQAFPKLQKKLISTAVGLLKPGGNLVYSTCSLSLEENEEVVSWVLDKCPQVHLVNQQPRLAGPGRRVSGLDSEQLEKLQRFDICSPGRAEDADTIGFFIARFKKCESTALTS